MKKIKLDIFDLIVAVIIAFFCGFACRHFCFISPSSEARFRSLESGFFESNAGETSPLPHTFGLSGLLSDTNFRRGSFGGIDPEQKETAIYCVTAYCPCEKCCEKWCDGVTASGHIIKDDDAFVAAPPELAFGGMVMVPGYNNNRPVPILDRGRAIQGNRLDVFFGDHDEALAWGVREFEVKQ